MVTLIIPGGGELPAFAVIDEINRNSKLDRWTSKAFFMIKILRSAKIPFLL